MACGVASLPMVLPGLIAIGAGLVMGLPAGRSGLRIGGAVLGLGGLLWLLTQGASGLLAVAGEYARVSPSLGFWCLLVVFMLLMADALAAMAPGPLMRTTSLLVSWVYPASDE